jgi:O-acetyl-ADP-ribose deacetylase (regulator of RNase III)
MEVARMHNVATLAFPGISTGVYGYPVELAAQVAVKTVSATPVDGIREIVFCCFSASDLEIYNRLIAAATRLQLI